MANARAVFNQADINGDGVLSQPEFKTFLARNSIIGSEANGLGVVGGSGGGYGSSSFESSAYESSATGGALERDLTYAGTGFGNAGYGSSAYESASSRSSVGDISNVNNAYNVDRAAGFSSNDVASGSYLSASRSSSVQQYQTDAQGNFKDSNPQLVRRPAQGGPVTYTQNIKVRFLRPPAVPPPGVSSLLINTHILIRCILLILAPYYPRSATTSTTCTRSSCCSSTCSTSSSTTCACLARTTTPYTSYCCFSDW